jgi:phosphoesterase RecJ-like protein
MKPSTPIQEDLIQFITSSSKFIVAGHEEPDGDCVGSQLALCSALRRLGKEALPVSAGPFKRTEVMQYAGLFCAAPSETEKAGAKIIVVDCSDLKRTNLESSLGGLPIAFIDHHEGAAESSFGEGVLAYRDADAPSATFLVFAVIEALGLHPTKEEAELLLFGLCTDTGFFRHVDSDGTETFHHAARMIEAGASPKQAFNMIHGGKSFNSRKLMGNILSRAETFFEGRLIISYETYEDVCQFGFESRDSDGLYQLLLSIAGVEAIALLRQETPEKCTGGLRSRSEIDVAAIAAVLGGGGHKNAAGFSLKGSISETRKKIIDAFGKTFSNH